MISTSGLDIRIANYLKNKLNNYILLREKKKKKYEREKWLQKFNNSNYILFPLNDNVEIKLYKDSVLSKHIYEGFEMDEIDFLNTFLKPGDWFVDIGSNVGLFSLHASNKVGTEGRVICFEPAAQTYDRLLENIDLNRLKNVKPFKMGLSDTESILELNISKNGFEAWNTFVQSENSKFSSKEQVLVKSFDNFFSENSFDTDRISLVKLDVEGFEVKVLKGASKLLSKENAPVFMVEFTDENAIAAGHCCHEIYHLLNNFGYTWHVYDPSRKLLQYDPLRISYPYNNLIAVKDMNTVYKRGFLAE